MLTFADIALETTIVYILIWGILFPAFVTGLIAYAVIIGRGEKESNDESRRFPRL
jgi:K+-transporting ATPase c subunit